MSEDPSPPGPGVVIKLFGAMLMALGGLIALLSGLCSLAFLAAMLRSFSQNVGSGQGAMSALPVVLLFGGVPFAAGIGLIIVGRFVYRGR